MCLPCVALLEACGGGSSDSGGHTSSSSSSIGSGGGAQALVGPGNSSFSATTSEGALELQGNISISGATGGTYYYTVSYVGTAIASLSMSGVVSSVTGTTTPQGPTAGRINGEPSGFGEGGIVKAQFGPVDTMMLALRLPAQLGAGTFTDTITMSACYDAACTQPVPGSPQTTTITYVITGSAVPDTLFTLAPGSLLLEASTTDAAPTATVQVTTNDLPPSGAYVFVSAGTGAAVAGTTFQSNQDGSGTLTVTAKAPATAGSGVHADSVQLKFCFDTACTQPAAHSPFTIPVTYIVDASPGVDFTLATVPLQIMDMAWNATTQRIYATVPVYAPTDGNSLVAINPASGTIESVLPLGSSAGRNIEWLALSDDGSYAYVYDSIPNQVYRVTLATMSVDQTIPLPQFTSVNAMAVAPGSPTTLAVDTYNNYNTVALYDGTTPRAQTFASTALEANMLLGWGADASTLYALETPGTLYRLTASGSGLALSGQWAVTTGSPTVIEAGAMQVAGGAVYFNSGDVIDATSGQRQPGFALQVTGNGGIRPSGFHIDTAATRAYFVSDDAAQGKSGQLTLQGFDLTTRQGIWITRFTSFEAGTLLIRWGANGLAFSVNNPPDYHLTLISGGVVAQ